MRKINEECGVFGMFSPVRTELASSVYYGLYALQHRGQESCGIVINDDGVFSSYNDSGLVSGVFTSSILESLGEGNIAVGHVRYCAASELDRVNAQPVVVNHIKGKIALSYNGSLVNYTELREELELGGAVFHTSSDAELITTVITRARLEAPSIEVAVGNAMDKLKGAYSIVVMSPSKLIAARDPKGFHPLCYGVTEEGVYVVASESCALDSVGATLVREILPGEVVVFDKNGVKAITDRVGITKPALCVFEYIYFARPDSVIEGVSVHAARLSAGAFLAKEHPVEADVVVGVPDSGIDAAIGYSRESGIPYGVGFIKNKYIGRTFIAPGQKSREDKVRIKLNPVAEVVKGKRVVLVDDSIVRGTTCARIVNILRAAGAKEVHMRVSSPPFLNPCYYGTDIPSTDVLLACTHTMEQMREKVGVDSLGFLSLDAVTRISGDPECSGRCYACFTGEYPTEIPQRCRKNKYDTKISEKNEE